VYQRAPNELSQTTSLVRAVISINAHPRCVSALGISWQWGEHALQQLLRCAVTARLMLPLPGGCMPAAAAAFKAVWSEQILSSSSSSSSGSSTGSASVADAARLICASVTASAGCLFEAAQRQDNAAKDGDEEMQESFAAQPVVAEVALQLLASRCLLLHKPLAQWQQQQRGMMSRQQGRHMKRDVLLLLPSDLQQQLAQLLPAEAMIDVIAANPIAGRTLDDMPAGEQDVLEGVSSFVSVLHLHVTSIAESESDGSISSPALSAAALQLSAVLLLLAAAEWQRRWCALTAQQQQLLKADTAALDEAAANEVRELRQQLAPVCVLLTRSVHLLQQQTRVLWNDGQWQPPLQLLQQGGGEVLLQGLTLAVHRVSLDCAQRDFKHLNRLFNLLEVLLPSLGAWP
jgi:hypothetical protein